VSAALVAVGAVLFFRGGSPPPTPPPEPPVVLAPEKDEPKAEEEPATPEPPEEAPVMAVEALSPPPVEPSTDLPPRSAWEQALPEIDRPLRKVRVEGEPGVLWSVSAFPPGSGDKDILGLVLDPDGRHLYTYGRDREAPVHEPKLFLCRWRVADGALVWANRLPCDFAPALSMASRHLAVPTRELPVPDATLTWMVTKRTGSLTGWLATPAIDHLVWEERGNVIALSEYDLDARRNRPQFRERMGALDRVLAEADLIGPYTRKETGVNSIRRLALGTPVGPAALAGRYVLAGGRDKVIRIWDSFQLGREKPQLYARHGGPAVLIRVLPEEKKSRQGPRVLSAALPGELHLWDLKTRERLVEARLPAVGATCLDVSPHGRYALVGDEGGAVRVVDIADAVPVGEPIPAHTGPVTQVAFAPDWRLAFTVGRKDGRLCCLILPTLE
jgi:hypothetical protein